MTYDKPGYRRMTYANPEQTREVRLPEGRIVYERIPQHPVRPARPYEWNAWWEKMPAPSSTTP